MHLKIAFGEIVDGPAGPVRDRYIDGDQRDLNFKCINGFLAQEQACAYDDNQQESKHGVRHCVCYPTPKVARRLT